MIHLLQAVTMHGRNLQFSRPADGERPIIPAFPRVGETSVILEIAKGIRPKGRVSGSERVHVAAGWMRILPIGNSRLEPLNQQLRSTVMTQGAFLPLCRGEVRVPSSSGSWEAEMKILPIGNSRLEPLNQQLRSTVKTQGAFLSLRVGGVGGADGERAGVRCLSHHFGVHGEGDPPRQISPLPPSCKTT